MFYALVFFLQYFVNQNQNTHFRKKQSFRIRFPDEVGVSQTGGLIIKELDANFYYSFNIFIEIIIFLLHLNFYCMLP